jgi:hypothetical protein
VAAQQAQWRVHISGLVPSGKSFTLVHWCGSSFASDATCSSTVQGCSVQQQQLA